MNHVRTAHQARCERNAAFDRRIAKSEDRMMQNLANLEFAMKHPQLGTLVRMGQTVYYVNTPTYRESSNPRELVEGGAL